MLYFKQIYFILQFLFLFIWLLFLFIHFNHKFISKLFILLNLLSDLFVWFAFQLLELFRKFLVFGFFKNLIRCYLIEENLFLFLVLVPHFLEGQFKSSFELFLFSLKHLFIMLFKFFFSINSEISFFFKFMLQGLNLFLCQALLFLRLFDLFLMKSLLLLRGGSLRFFWCCWLCSGVCWSSLFSLLSWCWCFCWSWGLSFCVCLLCLFILFLSCSWCNFWRCLSWFSWSSLGRFWSCRCIFCNSICCFLSLWSFFVSILLRFWILFWLFTINSKIMNFCD